MHTTTHESQSTNNLPLLFLMHTLPNSMCQPKIKQVYYFIFLLQSNSQIIRFNIPMYIPYFMQRLQSIHNLQPYHQHSFNTQSPPLPSFFKLLQILTYQLHHQIFFIQMLPTFVILYQLRSTLMKPFVKCCFSINSYSLYSISAYRLAPISIILTAYYLWSLVMF